MVSFFSDFTFYPKVLSACGKKKERDGMPAFKAERKILDREEFASFPLQ